MAYAAVPAPQQLHSWLVLAMGRPILQLTSGSHCGSAGFAHGSCAGPSRALKPHPPLPALLLPGEAPTLQQDWHSTDPQCQQQDRHLDHVWAPPTTQGSCRGVVPTRTPSSAQHRSLLPVPTYRGFPHACSWFRHRFGRFCFNRFSCSSTQRLCSLGLQGELVGDLERLPQREDDLVRQVL